MCLHDIQNKTAPDLHDQESFEVVLLLEGNLERVWD